MVKHYNAMVVFEEIPDEITLAINIKKNGRKKDEKCDTQNGRI